MVKHVVAYIAMIVCALSGLVLLDPPTEPRWPYYVGFFLIWIAKDVADYIRGRS